MTVLNVPIQLRGGNEVDCPTHMLAREVYVCLDSGKIFAGTGPSTSLKQLGGSAALWGGITGTLSNQTDLQTVLTALAAADSTEASTRAAADSTNATAITTEATTRASADSTEATARAAADTTLQSNITSEASTRATADSTNATAISNETSRATTAEGLLVPKTRTVAGHALSADVTLAEADITNLTTDLSAKEATANKDAASGYAGLDSGTKLKSAELPTDATGTMGLSELDVTTLKIDAANKDIILSRSAAASLAVTGSPNFKGSIQTTQLAAPAAPTVVPTNGSATSYGYMIVAKDASNASVSSSGVGGGAAGATTNISTGASTLDGIHFNTITWVAIAGAVSYEVWRTTAGGSSPTTLGLIATVAADATLSVVDNGLAGDNVSNIPTFNLSGNIDGPSINLASAAYFWGGYGPLLVPVAGSNIVMQNTNKVNAALFYLPFKITISKITAFVNAVSVSAIQGASFGLADLNGNMIMNTLMNVSSGQATGARTASHACTLQAGWYYFVWTTNSTDATFAHSVATANLVTIMNKSGAPVRVGTGATTSGGALPNRQIGTGAGTQKTTITATSLTLPYCLFE